MSEFGFDPKKADLGKEFGEFAQTVWATKRNYVIAGSILAVLAVSLLIPIINILTGFAFVLLVTGLSTFLIVQKTKIKTLYVLALPIFGVTMLLTMFVAAIPYALMPDFSEDSEQVAGVEDSSQEEDELRRQRDEAEARAMAEQQKREELETQIAEATTVNSDYDTGYELASQDVSQTQEANESIANLGSSTEGEKLFEVTQVVDGDTIKVTELGTLRLIGIDTPETKDPRKPVQCFGQEASKKAQELLDGRKVWLEFDPANRIDKYGRTLAYVYREDGLFYNREIIQQGFAHSYTKYPHPKMEEFNQAQAEARDGNKGLWSADTCSGDTEQPAEKEPEPKPTPAPTPKPAPTTPAPAPTPKYSCNCSKTCGQMSSCEEAYYQLNTCGCSRRDGDSDGVPCESICPGG